VPGLLADLLPDKLLPGDFFSIKAPGGVFSLMMRR